MFRIRNSTDALAWTWLAGTIAIVIVIGAALWKFGAFVFRLFT